ncbi:MAG: DUF1365 domain-containing protein [Vicinamibacterales bacterium]
MVKAANAQAVRPGIYSGTLRHRRSTPRVHDFTQRLFMVLLDVDRIPALMKTSWLTGYNRWSWASYHESDHVGDPGRPLRERLALDAARAGLALPDGPVFLLTHLRYLGYCFNPVSFFYCHDSGGVLRLLMAEVSNTVGGRQTYWVPARPTGPHTFGGRAEKTLAVSPFMPADVVYSFSFSAPGERLGMHIRASGGTRRESHDLDATLLLRHRPWTAAAIRGALLRHPAMTASVIGRIHFEALRLWWKGVPIAPRSSGSVTHRDATADASAAEP